MLIAPMKLMIIKMQLQLTITCVVATEASHKDGMKGWIIMLQEYETGISDTGCSHHTGNLFVSGINKKIIKMDPMSAFQMETPCKLHMSASLTSMKYHNKQNIQHVFQE
eukprot:2839522-Ditylum_brightwellii.AAC.1